KSLALFSGSVSPEFAQKIADALGTELGNVRLEKFSNGEIYARYMDSVRGADVFLIQSVAGEHINDALMELLIMADAAKRASARTITAVISHYGYARQDRKAAAREPITAKLVANLLTVAGVTRVMTIDLHQGQIQGFFDMPVDHLTALPILAEYFKTKDLPHEKLCVVSPDVGRAKAAKKFSDILDSDLAIMHKGRPGHNKAEITALIGDVNGKICILNDDMIDTGGSVVAAVETLKNKGAEKIYVCCTHPVFSGPGYERMKNLDVEEVVVCDTIPLPDEDNGKIKVVSVAPLFARAIA
ncbi:MAG: ribose-phosphate pyrophosphokinase, partial [Eggerthellaceae bacterium]|nr:ribose-phosphate pyrophosphokinase [Eggerthellaceae bacterium]